jgi:predicted phage terminase large subunit-like protein
MLSRNRSTSGIRPYVRATCNPEPGWLADFMSWWIDEEGYAIPERSGMIRWMVRENDNTYWSSDPNQLQAEHPNSTPKSVTFILSTVYDNQILLQKDPGYLSNLQALSFVDRERLLGDRKRGGNWKIEPAAGKIFNKSWFEIVDATPPIRSFVRRWDLAATKKKIGTEGKKDPDYTSSVKMGIAGDIVYIVDCTNEQIEPARTDTTMLNTAIQDGQKTKVRWEEEPGASGKRDSYHIVSMLKGYDARGISSTGDKITRAKPLAAQALAGNVKLLRGTWNDEFLTQMHGQPDLPHDDIMDAASGAYDDFVGKRTVSAW